MSETVMTPSGTSLGGQSPAQTSVGQAAEAADAQRRWLILATVIAGALMAILDATIVNVAIPTISAGLHASYGALELVIACYTLAYAVLVITGGRLGDLHGRRRLFIIGVIGFTLASALCGVAPSVGVLVVARVLQGIAAALLYPQVLAIIQMTFIGRERDIALSIFGAAIGLGAVAGQLLGGVLIQANLFGLAWRPVFLVNVPVGALTLVAALLLLSNQQSPTRARLDVGGVSIATLALLFLVVPLVAGRDAGWPAWMFVALMAAVPTFVLFVLFERRTARRGGVPLVDLTLFTQRAFTVGAAIALALAAANVGTLFVLTLYLQIGLGFAALHAGLTVAPYAAAFFVASLLAPRLIPGLGRWILGLGYTTMALGLLSMLAVVHQSGATLSSWRLAPALIVYGFGQGLGMTPLVGTIISRVPSRAAGAASGVVMATFQVGNALGVAVIGLLFFVALGRQQGADPRALQYAIALSWTLPAIAALVLVAFCLVFLLPGAAGQVSDVFLERVPHRGAAFAYALYFLTGGHLGERLIDELLHRTAQRRTTRVEGAPLDLPGYLVYHYTGAEEDREFLEFLTREALARDGGRILDEDERRRVALLQVDEIRQRQAQGIVAAGLDPACVRLMAFALTTYPRVYGQITRLVTGYAPDDPAFTAVWTNFLRQIGERLGGLQGMEPSLHESAAPTMQSEGTTGS